MAKFVVTDTRVYNGAGPDGNAKLLKDGDVVSDAPADGVEAVLAPSHARQLVEQGLIREIEVERRSKSMVRTDRARSMEAEDEARKP